jgi:DNA-binding CsgD family transcriptional regulator
MRSAATTQASAIPPIPSGPSVGQHITTDGISDRFTDLARRDVIQPIAPADRRSDGSSDRREERSALDRVLTSARDGVGGSLVLRGQPGTGKTSLLEYAIGRSVDLRVVRVAGAQPEIDLRFAALHRLLTPFLSRVNGLPAPQRDALGSVFGLVTAAAPDPFLVNLAVLTLLANTAADQPLLVAVDDAQWLDEETADALAFVARRLKTMPIALAIAVREPLGRVQSLDGLPCLPLAPHPQRRPSAPVPALPTDEPTGDADFERRHTQPAHGRQALLGALHAALMKGNITRHDTLLDAVRGALAERTLPQSQPTTAELLLTGFSTRLTAGYPAAAPILRAAVAGMLEDTSTVSHSSSALALGCWAAGDLLDSSAQRALATRWLRANGDQDGDADPTVPSGLIPLGPLGTPGATELLTLAWRGDEALARSSADEDIRNWTAAGCGGAVALAHYAMTILDLGLGRYEASLDSALKIYQLDPPDLGTRILPDLIEAAARSGDVKAGTSALERLSERALASGTRLASGLLARSQALLSEYDAEDLFREAIEHLRQSDTDVHMARTYLLYGEWLRRKRRRRDARAQLRAAQESFEHWGYAAFAHRAVVELQATGETVRKRIGGRQDQLTSQEAQITRLVVEGSSNRQVASQLFISQNTVEYHLQKVFRKVGVTSRTQLAHALLDPSRTDGPVASIAGWQPQRRRDPLTPLNVR